MDVLARSAALGSTPLHLTSLPEKQLRLFSFPHFFLLFRPEMRLSARENRLIVCFNGCSIPQVYPDRKISTKQRTGLTTGMMLMVIWVRLLLWPAELSPSSSIKQLFLLTDMFVEIYPCDLFSTKHDSAVLRG